MQCGETESWTFRGLVGAYVDLGIAYFLLCASSLAFSASKFLALFGLCLPCPCNGFFHERNRSTCWNRELIDSSSEKISSVQFSVRSRFPFDFLGDKNNDSGRNFDLTDERNGEIGFGDLEFEASCSSFAETGEMSCGGNVMRRRNVKDGKSGIKGKKRLTSQSAKLGLRRRKKGHTDHGRISSVVSQDFVLSDSGAFSCSPVGFTQTVNEISEISTPPFVSCGSDDSSVHLDFLGKCSHDCELNEPVDEDALGWKDAAPLQGLKYKGHAELCVDDDESNIRVLEKALEEQRAARAALYIELEKERSAAASAADEAMAMILRLQEEKASIEMDARQYQRMIEEKSAYDLEEMNLLKEILLRREREKHFLEREVENYRQLVFGSEQSYSDAQEIGITNGKRPSSLLSSTEDSMFMLQKINESNSEKQVVELANKYSEPKVKSIDLEDHDFASGRGLPVPEADEVVSSKQVGLHEDSNYNNQLPGSYENNEGSQKKELLPCKNLSITKEYNLYDRTVSPIEELKLQGDSISDGLTSKRTEYREAELILPHGCDISEKQEKVLHGVKFDSGPCVHDVHVIEDKCNMCSESENGSVKLLGSPQICDSPTVRRLASDVGINRSRSDSTNGLPPVGCSLSDLRRNSMSAVDFERFKIDNEVGWLQERLRLIQEGREKLNISMGNREKEKIQLQLLENILNQLREVRILTDPDKAARQASLPPLFSKETSKKRRWRSFSLGVHRSG